MGENPNETWPFARNLHKCAKNPCSSATNRERNCAFVCKWFEFTDWQRNQNYDAGFLRNAAYNWERYQELMEQLHPAHYKALVQAYDAKLQLGHFSVPYSVNKRNRWRHLDNLMHVEKYADVPNGVYAVTEDIHLNADREYSTSDYSVHCNYHRTGLASAVHSVNEYGVGVHKYANGSGTRMAQMKTLVERERQPTRGYVHSEMSDNTLAEKIVFGDSLKEKRYPKTLRRWASRRVAAMSHESSRNPERRPNIGAEWPANGEKKMDHLKAERQRQRRRVTPLTNNSKRRDTENRRYPNCDDISLKVDETELLIGHTILTPSRNVKKAAAVDRKHMAVKGRRQRLDKRAASAYDQDILINNKRLNSKPKRFKLRQATVSEGRSDLLEHHPDGIENEHICQCEIYSNEIASKYAAPRCSCCDKDGSAEHPETSPLTTPLTTVTSLDQFVVNRRLPRYKKRSPQNIANGRRGASVLDKPWVARISMSADDYVIVEEGSVSENSADDSGISEDQKASDIFAENPFDAMHIRVFDEEIEPKELLYKYKDLYFECSCVPRRFCIDISAAVQRILALNSGPHCIQSGAGKQCRSLANFEVAPVIRGGSGKLLEKFFGDDYEWYYEEDQEHSTVSVWLNTDADTSSGQFSLYDSWLDNMNRPLHMNEVLQSLARTVGLLPNEFFATASGSEQPKYECRNDKETILMPKNLSVDGFCLVDQEEANFVAMRENDLAKRLQRQLTTVQHYNDSQFSTFPLPFATDNKIGSLQSLFRNSQDCDSQASSTNSEDYCSICFGEISHHGADAMALAQCQHWFCGACWRRHFWQRVNLRRVPVMCPESGCDSVLDYDTACSLITLRMCDRYATLLGEKHVMRTKTWRYCPGRNCNRVLILNQDAINEEKIINFTPVTCPCGEKWCLNCEEKPHWPISCEKHRLYLRKLRNNGDLHDGSAAASFWQMDRIVQVRRCPHCKALMERSFGCNHMSCACGGQFCYICGGDWGSSHYNCDAKSQMEYQNIHFYVLPWVNKPTYVAVIYNIERVRLIDVDAATRQLMSDKLYVRCVQHREAVVCVSHGAYRTKRERRSIESREVASIMNIPAAWQEYAADMRKCWIMGHKVCEYALLWSQLYLSQTSASQMFASTRKRNERRLVSNSIRRSVEQLEFLLNMLGYKCLNNQKICISELVKKIERKSKSILSRIAILMQRC